MAKRSSGEESKNRSRAGETKPIGPEDEGVERPIWKEPRPTEREAKATETADNTDSNAFLSNSGDIVLDADITDEGRRGLAKEDGAELKDPKDKLGSDDDTTWLKDPKAELGTDDDTTWLKDPKDESADVDVGPTRPIDPEQLDPQQHAERPIWQEPRPEERASVPDTDPAGIIVPNYKEGADSDTDAAGIIVPDYKEGADEGDPAGLDVGPVNRERGDEGDGEQIGHGLTRSSFVASGGREIQPAP